MQQPFDRRAEQHMLQIHSPFRAQNQQVGLDELDLAEQIPSMGGATTNVHAARHRRAGFCEPRFVFLCRLGRPRRLGFAR